MVALWNRLPVWTDWIFAVALAIVALNLNVTDQGDPLSGAGLSTGGTTAGIGEAARAAFYASLTISGTVLASVGLAMATTGRPKLTPLIARTYGGVALGGIAGLLLDYRDGPIRAVHFAVYATVALGVIRFARIVSQISDEKAPTTASPD